MNLNNIFIASDVDGCLTPNVKHVIMDSHNKLIMAKSFSDRDSTAAHWLIDNGAQVVLISGDNKVNPQWAKSHNLPFIYVYPDKNKYYELIKKYPRLPDKYFIYIGDGEMDIPCLQRANIALYPYDASFAVKNAMKHKCYSIQMPVVGGGGVFDWVKEVLIRSI